MLRNVSTALLLALTCAPEEGKGDHWLAWGNLKGSVDGSLGSSTALFHAPYEDPPSDRGLFVAEEADLERWISGADEAGLQVSVHAIGDRANQQKISVEQTVTAYTRSASYAAFEKTARGILKPGYLADFVILDGDLTEIASAEIRNARVLVAVVGGKVVHEVANAQGDPS